jgi:hypothetical protein
MNDQHNGGSACGISARDVIGTGIVIGHNSSASVNSPTLPIAREVAAVLNELIQLVATKDCSIPDVVDIRESAAAAIAEVAEPSPRWPIVRGLLKGIVSGASKISVLTEVANNIQNLLAHLPR